VPDRAAAGDSLRSGRRQRGFAVAKLDGGNGFAEFRGAVFV